MRNAILDKIRDIHICNTPVYKYFTDNNKRYSYKQWFLKVYVPDKGLWFVVSFGAHFIHTLLMDRHSEDDLVFLNNYIIKNPKPLIDNFDDIDYLLRVRHIEEVEFYNIEEEENIFES